jgi:hypothetical protein
MDLAPRFTVDDFIALIDDIKNIFGHKIAAQAFGKCKFAAQVSHLHFA